jgi:hypothetical protein
MKMTRRILGVVLLGLATSHLVGCILPIYSADPQRRTRQLLNTSEDLRLFLDDWERIWFLDQPSHLTPFRNHGGLL